MPPAVTADFVATAKNPLTRGRPLYQDVAAAAGIGWELLAACDWMQCRAQPRYSPVYGEKLGTLNPDGTVFGAVEPPWRSAPATWPTWPARSTGSG